MVVRLMYNQTSVVIYMLWKTISTSKVTDMSRLYHFKLF
jgi:hypothetical protein